MNLNIVRHYSEIFSDDVQHISGTFVDTLNASGVWDESVALSIFAGYGEIEARITFTREEFTDFLKIADRSR